MTEITQSPVVDYINSSKTSYPDSEISTKNLSDSYVRQSEQLSRQILILPDTIKSESPVQG